MGGLIGSSLDFIKKHSGERPRSILEKETEGERWQQTKHLLCRYSNQHSLFFNFKKPALQRLAGISLQVNISLLVTLNVNFQWIA